MQPPALTRIVDLRPSLQPVNVHFIVLERGETTTIRKPEGGAIKDVPMSTARVSDGTGSVTLQLVGADECAPAALCPGDTYALRGGLFTTERGGGNALRAGRKGQLERTGYLTGLAADMPDMSAVRFEANAGTGLNEPVDPLPGRAWAPPVPHAVVLCGPQGAPALHPLPGPPALLHIGNEPAVGYLLRALEAAGTRSAILMCATDQVASKVGAWAAKHWPPTSRLALSVRTAPPGSGSGGALASALAALDLPPGSPLTIAPADLVTEGEPLGRAFLSHFKAGATLTALLAHRRASPATETKPGRAPRGVTYVALAGGGSRQAGAGDDGAATLAEAEPTLLHLALPPADPGAPPGREVSIPLAALAAAAAASASAGGAGTAALTLRSDLAASGLYVLDAGAAAGGLATLAARAAGGGGGAGSVSVGRDLVPYLLRRQFTPRDPSASEEGGGGAGGPDEAAKAAVAAPPADAATTTMTSTTAPASSAAAPPPRPVCQAHLAPRSRVCGRASTVQAYLELNRDVAAADAGLREGGGRGGGASAAGADGPAPAGGPPSASAPPPASIHPSTSLGAKAAVSLASIVGPDCVLGDRCSVKKSVLGSGVTVGKGAKVANCVLGAGAVVGENAAIQNSVICAGGRVGSRAVVRDARVGPGAEVGEGDELVEETVGGDLAVGSL